MLFKSALELIIDQSLRVLMLGYVINVLNNFKAHFSFYLEFRLKCFFNVAHRLGVC